jgi:hypothetical protein
LVGLIFFYVQVFGGENKVPPIEAIATSVGNDITYKPLIVFARRGNEVGWASTVNADDGRRR